MCLLFQIRRGRVWSKWNRSARGFNRSRGGKLSSNSTSGCRISCVTSIACASQRGALAGLERGKISWNSTCGFKISRVTSIACACFSRNRRTEFGGNEITYAKAARGLQRVNTSFNSTFDWWYIQPQIHSMRLLFQIRRGGVWCKWNCLERCFNRSRKDQVLLELHLRDILR